MSSKRQIVAEQLTTVRTYRVAPEVTSAVVEDYFEALDCPKSLAAAILFRNGEHQQLVDLSCNPLDYLNHETFRVAYCATEFLSKFKGLSLDIDLDEVALEKFKSFEDLCKLTNKRFQNLSLDPLYKGSNVSLHHAVARKIDHILGRFTSEEFFHRANWGPGATTLIKSRNASSVNKFQCETGITRELYSLLPEDLLFEVYPSWAVNLVENGYPNFQRGNKVVTVPKTAKTNRVIAIEPGLNLWFQKAVGEMIGQRLLRIGVDLRYQSVNQRLAYLGSKDLELATVDLSSASDSISYHLVRDLIPSRWFTVLDATRSRRGQLGELEIEWEKFSSMGNGFTFQLESLIFYAAAISCVEHLGLPVLTKDGPTVSVYGDDIILPKQALALFSSLIGFYGFIMNEKKTHYSSSFRESCGSHFFDGCDVKPIYLKDRLFSVPSVYRLANNLRRLSHRYTGNFGCDVRFRRLYHHLKVLVPRTVRFLIPDQFGDGGFISNFDEAVPARARWGIEGYLIEHVMETSLKRQADGAGLLLARLRDRSHQQESNSVPVRGRTKLHILHGRRRSLVSQWYDLGPWW